ncbi:MAG: glycosyltransferase family 1 protein [Candidatus Thorarchaeota archaeon]|nr:glycosyltransferase family 1 protein [Candidatus Thorarchaeota archaeon]
MKSNSERKHPMMTDNNLRLLMYSPLSLTMGAGGDRWLVEVAPRLLQRGVHPTVVASDFVARSYRTNTTPWFVDQLRRHGITYREIPSISFFHRMNLPLLKPEAIRALSHLMQQHDVTYFMNAYALQDLTVWIAKRMTDKARVISSQHSTMFQEGYLHNIYMHLVTRPLLRTFEAYHVLNSEDFATYRSWGLENAFMIPNGVDTQRFSPLRQKDQSEFTVLFVGRLDYQKGIDIILRAIERLEISEPKIASKIVLKICGTGPMSQMVEKFAEHRANVSYLGYVSDEELLELYKSVSLCLMPSRRETFGLVAMEAMASGTPVLVTDIPGPRTFVNDAFGKMVSPEDAESLAKGLSWFFELYQDDPDEFTSMGRRARDICVKEYDWNIVADKLSVMMKKTAEIQ